MACFVLTVRTEISTIRDEGVDIPQKFNANFDRNARAPKRGGLWTWNHRSTKSGRTTSPIGRNRRRNQKGVHKAMNFKQEELLERFVRDIQGKYSDVQLIEVIQSPEDTESLWIIVTAPEDEDREMELIRYSSEKAMDILCDTGYQFLVMPTRDNHLEQSMAHG